jgi:hypothetical protein
MHLAHPALTTTGRSKAKRKWASSEQKRQHEELANEWNKKLDEYKAMSKKVYFKPKSNSAESLAPRIPPGRQSSRSIPSIDSGHTGAISSKAPQMYTGNKMIGIGTLHKSNAVPIFSDDEAKDISRMRRG